jgi:catalase
VETEAIRYKMLGHLQWIDQTLAERVTNGLGAEGKAEKIIPAREPIYLPPSPSLSLYSRVKPTLKGRKVGVVLGQGFDKKLLKGIQSGIEKESGVVALVTAKAAGELDQAGALQPGEMALRGAPSVLFDAVVVLSGPKGDEELTQNPNAVSFLMDAFRHCKTIAWAGIPTLADKAQVTAGDGLIDLDEDSDVEDFIEAARTTRFWERESETPGVI